MDSKRCKKCGEMKPLDAYYRTPGTRDGRRGDCIACNLADKARRHRDNPEPARERAREWHADPANRARTAANHERYRADGRKQRSNRASHLKRKYGITIEQYDAKLAEQAGVCAICRCPPRSDISLHVDHNHVTGELRGLLCFSCNVTVGHVREDHERLQSIASYLTSHDPEAVEMAALARERVAALRR
jgi:hypothetical protein